MMQTLITITIVVLLLLQTPSGASAVPVEEEQLLLPVGGRVRRNAVCEKVGRIPDYESIDCKTYYVCTPNTQGSLIAILSQCPSSSVFSFEQLKCVPSADYSCPVTTIEPEQTTTTTTKTPEPAFVCPTTGRFANPQSLDCGSYYLCTRNTDGSLIAVVVTCPGTSIFDPDLGSCVLAPHFCAQTTTTETTVVTPGSTVSDGFVCPAEGRYPNLESADCSRYYLCLESDGAIVANPAICPLSTIFSPIVRQCVDKSSYVCPSQTPAPPIQTTTTPLVTTPTTRTPEPVTTTEVTPRPTIPVIVPTTTTSRPVTTTEVTPRPTIPVIIPTTTTSRPVITTEVTTLPTEAQTITVVVPTTTTPAPITTTEVTPRPTIPVIIPTTTTPAPVTTTEIAPSPTELPTTTTEVTIPPTTTTPAPVTTTEVTPRPTIPVIIPTTTTSRPVTTTEVAPSPTEAPTTTTEVTISPSTTTSRPVTTTEVTPQPTISIVIPTTTTPAPVTTTDVTTPPTEPQTITIVIPTTTMPTEITTTTEEEVTSTTSVEVTTAEIDTTPETTSASTAEVTFPESTTTDTESTMLETTEQPTETEPTLTTAASSETTVTDTFESTTEFSESTTEATEAVTTTDTPTTTDGEQTTASETTSEEPEASTTEAESTTEEQSTTEEPTTTDIGTSEITTTEPPTTTDASPDNFICPTEGRYPDPKAVACESYILCIANTLGTLTPLTFVCPPTTIFSLIMKMCVSSTTYNCAATPTDPPPTVTTSTVPTTSEIVTPKLFVCPAPGRYTKPESIYCKTYYLCLYNAFGVLDAVELSCPAGSIFAREVSRCEPDTEYECIIGPAMTTTESSSSLTPSTTTTSEATSAVTTASSTATVTTSPATTKAPFQCSESGKFVNPDSADCTTYKYCISATVGFTQYTFACPRGALFDPEARDCSGVYVCQVGKEPFVCTAPGKYVNQERNDCKTYKYCITMVGGFTQYIFNCPNGSLFDPNTRLCSATYTCPAV